MLWLHNKICFGEERRKLISWLLFLTFSASFSFLSQFLSLLFYFGSRKRRDELPLAILYLVQDKMQSVFLQEMEMEERREILFLVFGPKATRASSSSWQRHQNQILLLVPRCNSLCSILWIFNPSHYLCSIPSKGIRIFRSCSTNCSVLDILCPHIDNMILSITFAKNWSLNLVIAHNISFPALLEL